MYRIDLMHYDIECTVYDIYDMCKKLIQDCSNKLVQTIFRLSRLLSHPSILNCLWYLVYTKILLVATVSHTTPTIIQCTMHMRPTFVLSLFLSGSYIIIMGFMLPISGRYALFCLLFELNFPLSNFKYSHLHVNHIN